ncbi:MAG: UbiA-like polyprenyltransferase [Myxococcota bacterium]|nr:UbiA-like polyprenyltransferase [Myxococcota bacterium]
MSLVQSAVDYSRMIKLSHTLFALPFALAAAAMAWQSVPFSWVDLGLILVCMVTARSAAMGFNRIADRDIDGANPRTASREIPSGKIPLGQAWGFTLGSAAIFVLASWGLSTLCLILSPFVLAVVMGYSLTKRFTALCHLFLGLALGLAPVSAWIAITDTVSATALVLSGIVLTWVGGFDILYACQDADFDREKGLNSIPAALGLKGAMIVSALLHVGTAALLAVLPFVAGLGWPYWIAAGIIGAILVWEHLLVRPDDLSRMDQAFFQLNSTISLIFIGGVLAGSFLG